MDIEKVKVSVGSLKAGGKVYLKNTVFSKPFLPAIIAEIRAVVKGQSNTLEILERTGDVKVTSPPVVEEPAKELESDVIAEDEEVETSDQENEQGKSISDPPETTKEIPALLLKKRPPMRKTTDA